jgi:hypothetical protein
MPNPLAQTTISLRGSLCRDLLEMVASGASAAEAATQLISELLDSTDSRFLIHRVGDVFVIERREDSACTDSSPTLFQ